MQTLTRFLPVNNDIAAPAVSLNQKYEHLRRLLCEMGQVVVCFSGGADSALLTKVSYDELGANAVAVIALSESYPKREMEDALDANYQAVKAACYAWGHSENTAP